MYQSQQCTDLSLAEWLITFTNDLLKNQTIKQLQLELDEGKKKYIQVSEQLDSNDRLVQKLLQDISRMEKNASAAASQAERLESILVHLQLRHIFFKMQLTMLTEPSQHTIVFNNSRLKGRRSGIGVKACSSALML